MRFSRARRSTAQQNTLTTYQDLNGSPVLALPKPGQLSVQVGPRTSSEGTQASGEGESHTQDANVAEVNYGEPVIGKPEYPDNACTTRR